MKNQKINKELAARRLRRWRNFVRLLKKVQEYRTKDPEASLNKARMAAEIICRDLLDIEGLCEYEKYKPRKNFMN